MTFKIEREYVMGLPFGLRISESSAPYQTIYLSNAEACELANDIMRMFPHATTSYADRINKEAALFRRGWAYDQVGKDIDRRWSHRYYPGGLFTFEGAASADKHMNGMSTPDGGFVPMEEL